ncbi:MAG: UTP--glucose-1-phosphate uridylyltransferase GalU [Actinomycetota bacterium]
MPVRKAVIPAAGLGTRTLPASKAVPKVLIPVVDRPAIQYAVEEIVRAGISNICIVLSRGQESVGDHFTADPELEAALGAKGREEVLEEVRRLHHLADIFYVRQQEPRGLGHAVWTAREHVGDEPFAVVLPDEIYDPAENILAEMIQTYDEHGSSTIAVKEVPNDQIHLYGAIGPENPDDETLRVRTVIEKPEPDQAPSNLASVGRYVLAPDIFEVIAKLEPGAGGEIQLADALDMLAREGRLLARRYDGRRWDVGTKPGFLQATVTLAAERADLGPAFRRFLESFRA